MKNFVTSIEKIGPRTAKKYLENQARNRALNKRTVNKYAAVMLAGAWEMTHQGIAFDADGKLFDGQHRMAAIVQSGATVEMQVSRYSTEGAPMSVIDSGHARSMGDRITIAGVVPAHGTLVYSIISAMVVADSGADGRGTLHPHEVASIYESEKKGIEFAVSAFGSGHSKQWNAIVRSAFAYCYAFAPKECTALATMIKEKCGYGANSAAHAFVLALAGNKFGYGRKNRTDVIAKALWLIRQHIEGKSVVNVKASASIFNWAKRQRQLANVPTIAEVLA